MSACPPDTISPRGAHILSSRVPAGLLSKKHLISTNCSCATPCCRVTHRRLDQVGRNATVCCAGPANCPGDNWCVSSMSDMESILRRTGIDSSTTCAFTVSCPLPKGNLACKPCYATSQSGVPKGPLQRASAALTQGPWGLLL